MRVGAAIRGADGALTRARHSDACSYLVEAIDALPLVTAQVTAGRGGARAALTRPPPTHPCGQILALVDAVALAATSQKRAPSPVAAWLKRLGVS